jgi:hypothetical protein
MFAEGRFGGVRAAFKERKIPANKRKRLVDRSGVEPLTSAVQRRQLVC